jgi:hypothetical protein
MNIEESMQFIQYPISALLAKPTPHPEVRHPRSPFDLMCSQVHLKREHAVITYEGNLLAFFVSDLPPKIAEQLYNFDRVPFNKACLNLSWFEVRDKPALCLRRNRPWFWLVPPSYQQWLDLPVLGAKDAN